MNGSYIDEITRPGKLVWSVQLPISYPSDPQQLGPDRYLVADYATPGGIYEFNRAGKILWSYHPSSGNGMLNHPSLAERLPSGLIAANDDYRDRVVIIDPRTKKIVWQYGRTGSPGRGPATSTSPTASTCWPRTGPPRPTRIRAERELLRRPGGGELSPFLGVRLGGSLPSLTQYGSTEFEGAIHSNRRAKLAAGATVLGLGANRDQRQRCGSHSRRPADRGPH